jgi:flagellar biosynthesis/type III secretory pathway protein FliH
MSRINTLPKEQLEDWQQELMDNQYIQGAIKMAAEEAAEEAAKEAYNEGLIKGRKAEKKLMIQRLRKQGFSEDQIKKLFELD